MQKNIITNKITPCCGLPFSVVYWWVSNLTLNSESDRQFILSKISQGGVLSIDAWKVLINSGTLEADASLTKAEFLAWFDCGKQPNCEQLKLLIEGFEVGGWTPEDLKKIINNYYTYNVGDLVPTEALYVDENLAGDILKRVQNNNGENVNYRKTTKYIDGSVMTDQKIDGYLFIKRNGEYYRKVTDDISVLDFGAKGDGVASDAPSFWLGIFFAQKTKSKRLIIPDGYTFDLGGNEIDAGGVTLVFNGSIVKNAKFTGLGMKIDAGRIQIFGENITLFNRFVSFYASETGHAYPEWFGYNANNENYDVVDYIEKLIGFFESIQLGNGIHHTKRFNLKIEGTLCGIDENTTLIQWQPQYDNIYLFCLGVYNGTFNDRDYYKPTIKNLSIHTQSSVRRKGLSAIVVGACSRPTISGFKINQQYNNLVFDRSDLEQFVLDRNSTPANVGINFIGDSELICIENGMILSDIPIKISNFIDFVQGSDLTFDAREFGIACIYYTASAVNSQNINFIGSISCNQGLYGIYTEDSSTSWNAMMNNIFNGIRVEQLNGTILNQEGKVEAKSIRLGSCSRFANPSFRNMVCAGSGAAFEIVGSQRGSVVFENISLTREYSIPVPYTFRVGFWEVPNPDFKVYLKNFEEYSSVPNGSNAPFHVLNNCNLIDNSINKKDGYIDDAVITKIIEPNSDVVERNYMSGVNEIYQTLKIQNNNLNYIKLAGYEYLGNFNAVKYKIEVYIMERLNIIEFVLWKDFYVETIKNDDGQKVAITNSLQNGIFNILVSEVDKTVFLFNRLGVDAFVSVSAKKIKF